MTSLELAIARIMGAPKAKIDTVTGEVWLGPWLDQGRWLEDYELTLLRAQLPALTKGELMENDELTEIEADSEASRHTNQTEHTPEPWRTDNDVIASGDIIVAKTNSGLNKSSPANARRIVACVNYCAGLSTNYLEARDYKKSPADPMLGIPSQARLTALERVAETALTAIRVWDKEIQAWRERIARGGVQKILSSTVRERLNVMGHALSALRKALAALNS